MGKQKEAGVLTVSLKMMDRLALLGLLPERADYGALKLVKQLQDMLTPEPGESEKLPGYEKDEVSGVVRWDGQKEKGKNFTFSGFALKMIVEKLQTLDREAKLTLSHIPLWEKFIIGEGTK